MAPQNVCRYWKFGHCKFADKCRLMHVDEVCQNPECEIKTCNMRHPRVCTYFRDYRRCKFGEYCSFKHEENDFANIISDNQKTSDRLSEIEIILKEKDNLEIRIDAIDKKIAGLDKYLENILERQNNKIEDLEKKIEDMGVKIATLESQKAEYAFENENKFEERITKIERRVYVIEKTNAGNEFCEFCEEEFEEDKELDIHIRDTHTFKCNLCDIQLGNKEDLYMHFLTCEIYKCYTCDHKNKRLSELKSHIKTKHEDRKVTTILHIKMNKEDYRKKICTRYSSEDI